MIQTSCIDFPKVSRDPVGLEAGCGDAGREGALLLQGSWGHCLRDSWWGWATATADQNSVSIGSGVSSRCLPKGFSLQTAACLNAATVVMAKLLQQRPACLVRVSEGTGLGQAPLPLG